MRVLYIPTNDDLGTARRKYGKTITISTRMSIEPIMILRGCTVRERWEHRPAGVLPSFLSHTICEEELVRRYIRIIQRRDERRNEATPIPDPVKGAL